MVAAIAVHRIWLGGRCDDWYASGVLAGKFGCSVGPDKGVLHAGALDLINTPLAINQAAVLPDGSQVDLGPARRSMWDWEPTTPGVAYRTGFLSR